MKRQWSPPIKVGGHPEVLEGTYRNQAVWLVGWLGAVVILLLGPALLVLQPELIDAGTLAALAVAAVVGACALWFFGARSRFEVTRDGVTITNPLSTTVLAWSEIRGFESQSVLFVMTYDGHLKVTALPAAGPRRDLFAVPGRVDELTRRLNARLVEVRGDEVSPAPLWIETEGRTVLVRAVVAAAAVVSSAGLAWSIHTDTW